MPPDPISSFLLGIGINPVALLGALVVAGAITSIIAIALMEDDTP